MNNEMLVAEINSCRKTKVMSNSLARMFMTLVDRYRNKVFIKIAGEDDMKAHALLTLTRTWQNYDPAVYDNLFAVFNKVIHAAFLNWAANEMKATKLTLQLQDLTPDE